MEMHIYIDANVKIDNFQFNCMVDACINKLESFFGDVQVIDERNYKLISPPKRLYKWYIFQIEIDQKLINKAKLTNYKECMEYFDEIILVDTLLLVSGSTSTIRNYYIKLVN